MSYKSNKDFVNKLIDFVGTRIEKRTALPRHFREFLEEGCNVWIYTEMPPAVKENYDKYIEDGRTDTVHDYRGLCFNNQYIRAKKMSRKEFTSKVDIVIHNLYETMESAAWILLHEYFHAYLKNSNPFDWLPEAIHSMDWVWEDRYERLNPGKSWQSYYRTDIGHEEKPQEIICNLYATTLIGKNYDRHWWRENMAPKREK